MWGKYPLYPYQMGAAETMAKSNVLLAYDMGTGKTPTTLAAVERMRQMGEIKKWGTVLVPASLKYQWQGEILKFTDQVGVVIDGTPNARRQQYADLEATYPGYLIMSYDTWVRDIETMNPGPGVANGFMILDEATAIKSFKAQRTKMLKKYRRQYDVRLALSGTPIENGKLEEIYSILEWVDPTILPKWHHFEATHIKRNPMGWIDGYKNIDKFHRRIKPYVLRKTVDDPDVETYMPKVVHFPPFYVKMDAKTNTAYGWLAADTLARLDELSRSQSDRWKTVGAYADPDENDPDHPDGELMARIQVMRMLLDHPLSVLYSAARYEDPDDSRGSAFAARIATDGLLDDVVATPKLDDVIGYLKDFFDAQSSDSKVVLFCSFVDVAKKISEALPWQSVVFTGSMPPAERDRAKQRFVSDPDVKVFVSTDAGGYGLDLPQANLLINYDLPWQAGLLKQRNARIRRASSKWKHVFVQDFIVTNTIEERMAKMLRDKHALASGAIDGTGITEDGLVPVEADSLRVFIEDLLGR